MNKQLWILSIIILTFALSACNTVAAEVMAPTNAEFQSAPAAAEPAASPASSTEVVVDDVTATTSNPASRPATTENNTATETAASTNAAPVQETDSIDSTNSASSSLSVDRLARVMDGQAINATVNVWQGPDSEYAQLGTLQLGQLVDVLAINPNQDWVLIKSSGLIGWVLLDEMALFDSPDALPAVLSSTPDKDFPPGEIAPIFAVSVVEEPDA